MTDREYCAQYADAEYSALEPPVIELVESKLAMSEQQDNVNERLARLALVAELVRDVVKSARSVPKVLGDMATAVDNLVAGQSQIASQVGGIAPQIR